MGGLKKSEKVKGFKKTAMVFDVEIKFLKIVSTSEIRNRKGTPQMGSAKKTLTVELAVVFN